MALRDHDRKNFETLLRAAEDEALCLFEARDKATGEYRALLCAVEHHDDGEVELKPLAVMPHNNPYDLFDPMMGD